MDMATALVLSVNSENSTTHTAMRATCSISSTTLTVANFFSPHSTPRNAEYTPENSSAGSMSSTSVMENPSANSAPIGLLNSSTTAQMTIATIISKMSAAEHSPALSVRLVFAVSLDTTSGTPEVRSVSSTKKNDSATEYTPMPTAPISRDRYILNKKPSTRSATVNAVSVITARAIDFMALYYVESGHKMIAVRMCRRTMCA